MDALENLCFEWDVSGMTVLVDLKNCVQLPTAQPGDHFDLRVAGVGKFVLTRLESDPNQPDHVKIERRGGFTVGVLDRPIDEQSLAEALSEFPLLGGSRREARAEAGHLGSATYPPQS